MGSPIKTLRYEVWKDSQIINQGTVPAIIAIGGSDKDYDLTGIWIDHETQVSNNFRIDFYDGNEKILSKHSGILNKEWINYRDQHGLDIREDSFHQVDKND